MSKSTHERVKRIKIERQIVERIIDNLFIAQPQIRISVFDSFDADGETVLHKSRDRAAILKAMFSTDGDTLRLYRASFGAHPAYIGCVVFIYGNGDDVVHDWSDKPLIDHAVQTAVNAVLDNRDAIIRDHAARDRAIETARRLKSQASYGCVDWVRDCVTVARQCNRVAVRRAKGLIV